MSNETILPPSIPEDAAKSTVPPTPNIRQTGPAKLLQTSITGVVIESINSNDRKYPFVSFANGVVARCCKASINLTGAELPGVYSKYTYPLANDWDTCVGLIAKYFYKIYTSIVQGETSLPYHPRNVGFCLMAMARNRVAVTQGQVNLYILSDTTVPVITDQQIELVATLMRHQALCYDLVNVPVFESGPFPSSKEDQAKSTVEEYKMSIDQLGSTYTTYVRNSSGTTFYDYYAEDIDVSTWWIKAALAVARPPPQDTQVTATWSNITLAGEMLAMWVSYSDTVCDVPYVFMSQPYLPTITDAPELVTSVPIYSDILNAWKTIYADNGETFTGDLFQDLPATSHVMYRVFTFASCMYSPFGQITDELYISPSSSPALVNHWERLLFSSTWRTPIYLPSLFSECISSVAEQTIIKSTQEGFTHSTQIFNLPHWPQYKSKDNITAVTIGVMVASFNKWEQILNYRKFIKLNLNPEYKVNKAVMPYFFLHVPIRKNLHNGPDIVVEAFDAIITPYSARYIEDHNLHVLCRSMPWPRVYEISQPLVSWLPIIDIKPILPDGGDWDKLLPAFDIYQFSLLCVDMSYMADGCEVDAYLNKLRTTHLGFFAALAGLLPTAIKIGTALFKTIAKPDDIDSVTTNKADGPAVDRQQTNNMAMAGISSISQTINGEPGAGGTVDLSRSVNVDPIERVMEAGKKYIRGKKITQAVTFGGKALKFGRSLYNNYKNNQ